MARALFDYRIQFYNLATLRHEFMTVPAYSAPDALREAFNFLQMAGCLDFSAFQVMSYSPSRKEVPA